MDAVKFLEERARMCGHGCVNCKAYGEQCNIYKEGCDFESLVKAVEAWAAEHPKKTRQSEFLKQWPNVKLGVDGVVPILPCGLDTEYPHKNGCIDEDGYCTHASRGCAKCSHDFWMQEVE